MSDKLIDVAEYLNHFDIIMLSETWLRPNSLYNLNMNDHLLHTINRPSTNKRAKRGSGGLICYYRKEIMDGIEFINGLEHTDRLWVKLVKNFLVFQKIYMFVWFMLPLNLQHVTHQETMYGIFYKLK